MSERERWIVYPLLFLALGVGLRDEFADRTWSKNVICQNLIAVQDDRTNPQSFPIPIALLGTSDGTIDEVNDQGMLRVDTVWARTVVADNFTTHDRRMNLVPYLLQLLGTSLRPATPSPSGNPGPPLPSVDADEPEVQPIAPPLDERK